MRQNRLPADFRDDGAAEPPSMSERGVEMLGILNDLFDEAEEPCDDGDSRDVECPDC